MVLTARGKAVAGLYPPEHPDYLRAQQGIRSIAPFRKAAAQLKEYFSGKRRNFQLPLEAAGTPFQKKVRQALRAIPYGRTRSYQDIARTVKTPKAARAVGMANRKNPLCILVPCHRVIGANGKLTGYAGGLKAKQWLLTHEAGI